VRSIASAFSSAFVRGGRGTHHLIGALFAFVLGALALTLANPDEASAYVPEPVVLENVPAIADHAARGGATSVPGVNCGAQCADWWLQEHRPIPNQPSSEQLHRELRTFRSQGVRVLPPLRLLGTIGLAAEVFHVGWKIGGGLNSKILKIGVPPATDGPDYYRWHRIRWQSARSREYYGAFYPAQDGWVIELKQTCCTYSEVDRWFEQPCTFSGFVPPQPFVTHGPEPSTGTCWTPEGSVTSGVLWGWAPENVLGAPGPVEDYTSQPYSHATYYWEGEPAIRTELETRTRTALESGEYPLLDPWYAHLLDPQTYEDPTEDEQQRDDCRPADSVPAGDPAPLRGTQHYLEDPVRWRARYETVPASEFPPGATVPEGGLVATGGQAYMRWGWTSLNAKEKIDWQGWGYRKIVAKHGWGPTALEKTSEALITMPTRRSNYDEYVGPPYSSRSGTPAACEWVVSVQREPLETPARPELSQEMPMGGIITAHGRYVTPG